MDRISAATAATAFVLLFTALLIAYSSDYPREFSCAHCHVNKVLREFSCAHCCVNKVLREFSCAHCCVNKVLSLASPKKNVTDDVPLFTQYFDDHTCLAIREKDATAVGASLITSAGEGAGGPLSWWETVMVGLVALWLTGIDKARRSWELPQQRPQPLERIAMPRRTWNFPKLSWTLRDSQRPTAVIRMQQLAADDWGDN